MKPMVCRRCCPETIHWNSRQNSQHVSALHWLPCTLFAFHEVSPSMLMSRVKAQEKTSVYVRKWPPALNFFVDLATRSSPRAVLRYLRWMKFGTRIVSGTISTIFQNLFVRVCGWYVMINRWITTCKQSPSNLSSRCFKLKLSNA